jgi:Zn-dependent metalloprotease
MRLSIRLGCVLLLASVASFSTTERTRAQNEPADDADARIAGMLATGELVRSYSAADPQDPNRTHEYFTQRHLGVPVFGGGVSRQRAGDRTISVFGTIYLGIDLAVAPRMTTANALAGLRAVAASPVVPGDDLSVFVMPELTGSYRLVYRAQFVDGKIRTLDAMTGELIRTEDAFVSQRTVGTGRGQHGDEKKVSASRSGDSYQALDLFRPAQINTKSTQGTNATFESLFAGAGTTAVDPDNVWTNPAVVDAHVHTGWTYDYFNQRMGWNGLDGQNALINQVVTDRATIDTNAFFSAPGAGSGTGVVAYGVTSTGLTMATLDIVAHELMHGVTHFSVRRRTGTGLLNAIFLDDLGPTVATSGTQSFPCATSSVRFADGTSAPFYCINGQYVLASNHGGAVNEGFSDVFGTAVEFRHHTPGAGPLRGDYINGEDAVGGGFRSLIDPGAFPADPTGAIRYPEHYGQRIRYLSYVIGNSAFLTNFTIVNGRLLPVSLDSGGVHFNATIMGHVYYRAVEGGTHRVSGVNVPGVGFANREQVERIFFRAMTQLLPNSAPFPLVGAALRQSAIDLYGSGSAAFRAIDGSLAASGL